MYELWEIDHLKRFLPWLQADCVFDVGANLGQYATMLRTRAAWRGRIISFEPIPEAAARLRELARGDPLWQVEEVALAAATGSQVFNIMNNSEFSSLSAPRHDDVRGFEQGNRVTQQVTVRTEALTEAFARLQRQHGFARPFLKLDTQGMDLHIARAAGRDGLAPFVGLQSELAVRQIYADSVDFRDALREYEQMGFELSAVVPSNAGHFPRLVEFDCILGRADLLGHRITS
jgi:FkbM family methyltransferase